MNLTLNAVQSVYPVRRVGDRPADRALHIMELGKAIAKRARDCKAHAESCGLKSVALDVGNDSAIAVSCAINILIAEGLDVVLNRTQMVISW